MGLEKLLTEMNSQEGKIKSYLPKLATILEEFQEVMKNYQGGFREFLGADFGKLMNCFYLLYRECEFDN